MRTDTEIIIVATIFVLLFGLVSRLVILRHTPLAEEHPGSWACTADAMICSDGTSVGRVPPYCLFAACPTQ
jgi:hypothetical protein